LNNGGEYVEETYYWQGRVFAAQGRTGEAATAFRNALRHNSHYTAAQEALNALDA
jgi:TolA-binding protein